MFYVQNESVLQHTSTDNQSKITYSNELVSSILILSILVTFKGFPNLHNPMCKRENPP